MRHLPVLLVSLSFGCAEVCPTANQALNQSGVWRIFNKPSEILTPPVDDYPSDSPVSGDHELFVQWGSNADKSPITVGLDGNEFSGTGVWDGDECGNFQVVFSGIFTGEDLSLHAMRVNGWMQTWEGHLEGVWSVYEEWKYDGEQGVTVDEWTVQVIGTL